ncbi:DHA2 family efflux MFS transporter permease subunit [Actinoplanes sp. LDG1-06]|uniref:DHA2 family efflux MFS transporter permease subunit n=1 Tax=Paractinoplanes ovalisporus TaxID=2810368 RepID=A0ABS2AFZ0_9ACTN|nr:MDR family MFS transporter [Actinoplanes ovalisporus]MBM2618308.1 DHA2 family efflux MFS transporter permease subunit [Actinoplanes ovalisporus]
MATVTTQEAPPAVLSRRQVNVVFTAILLGMLLAALDQTIVSTALPTIVADLGGAGHMSWVVTAYLLAETVSTVLAGKFGDLFGRKLVFQISTVVFVGGSVLCGVAQDMVMLIGARAIQGIGGGGLMVTAMALIADVIPLRDRGRYQGALGAVFGVTTVVGPTLGGLFTDHLSWRWAFYVNVPVAIVVLAMSARALPSIRSAARPIVDYAGIGLVAAGASSMILALSWGGNEYEWGSPVILGLFAAAVVLLSAFVVVETRVREPMLPMHLFRNSVFTVCSTLSFIVGFAMLGAMTFLPTYLQYVNGVSATDSGVRTLPMVAGLFLTSILSGNLVSRTGRYKAFPIAGGAVMTLGLYLMSTMDQNTSAWLESLYMFVLGAGIGLSMQVLTIVVQNTVPYGDLGTATSGVTFFRTLGSSFGTAIFGTLFTNQLTPNLADAFAAGAPPEAAASPEALHKLAAAQAAPIISAYAETIGYVFRWVVPVALLGFLVAWLLKELPLRDSARAAATDVGEGFSPPQSGDRLTQLERAISDTMFKARDDRDEIERLVAESGTTLPPAQLWAVGQTHLHTRARGHAEMTAIARTHRMPPEVIEPAFTGLVQAGYARREGDTVRLTDAGQEQLDRVQGAYRNWLDARLEDITMTDPADRALIDQALDNIATRIVDEGSTRRPGS